MDHVSLLLIIKSVIFVSATLGDVCQNVKGEFEIYLGTKTAYRVWGNTTSGRIEISGCKPVKLWMFGRHGTRYPGKELINVMETRLNDIRHSILENNPESTEYLRYSHLDALREWDENAVSEDIAKDLAFEGMREWSAIAERLQIKFPEVFDKFYTNSSYKIKSTDKLRTEMSAKSFAKGLFGEQNANDIQYPKAGEDESILQFFLECGKWSDKFVHEALLEKTRFEASLEMSQVVAGINMRLSLNDTEITFEDVDKMFWTCVYETARDVDSPWCPLFTIDDLKMLEYYQDVKNYYLHGPGFKSNYNLACIALSDMIRTFETANMQPKVTAYFSHTASMLRLITLLGLYQTEKPPTADNYKEFINHRVWKGGYINPFANNLVFVLYKCDSQLSVLTLHDERIVRLPACPDEDLCPLVNIKEYFKATLDHCTHESLCTSQ